MHETNIHRDFGVSVIIPLGPRREGFTLQLRAVHKAIPKDVICEIIISSNAKANFEWAKKQIEFSKSINALVIDSSGTRGPSAARNAGWRAARSNKIMFCDSDDIVHPDWIKKGLVGLEKYSLVIGSLDHERLNQRIFDQEDHLATKTVEKFNHRIFGSTSNMAVKKNLLVKLDGFNEELATGEDVDFCWRAQYLGYEIKYLPDMKIFYKHRSTLFESWKQSFTNSVNDLSLLKLHSQFGAKYGLKDFIQECLSLTFMTFRPCKYKNFRYKLIARSATVMGRICWIFNINFWR